MSEKHSRFRSAVLCLALLSMLSILVAACHEGSSPTAPAPFQDTNLQSTSAYQKPDKEAVCHIDDEGNEKTVMLPANAVDNHLAHGDYAGECGAAVQCPCYDADTLDALAFTSSATCYDYPTFVLISERLDGLLTTVQNLNFSFYSCSLTTTGSQNGITLEEFEACNDIALAHQEKIGCLP